MLGGTVEAADREKSKQAAGTSDENAGRGTQVTGAVASRQQMKFSGRLVITTRNIKKYNNFNWIWWS
ncbi:hypothetical protein GCM10011385_07720 [Nitratireductor aestuarii]|uniref:Uncharacterized protein n=1 Tax=Nitratireductor aestuarii TaxID=1735103 RepID=A0A916RHC6_9HYPH|nr:hypothetical protein [Nitratireductor aestuarii]GGA56686.1 hypothetical protein GCM10011385_07720 [Nitratireductor aestuarii]